MTCDMERAHVSLTFISLVVNLILIVKHIKLTSGNLLSWNKILCQSQKESYTAGYITQAEKMVPNIFVRLQVTSKFHMAKAAGYPYVFLGACFHLGSKADSSDLMDNETL